MSFQTVAGTASPSDYVASAGSLTFDPGETSKTVTVEVKGDDRREPDETFYLRLHAPSSNASLTSSSVQGTILNDDSRTWRCEGSDARTRDRGPCVAAARIDDVA